MDRHILFNVAASPCRICPCCYQPIVFLYSAEGVKKRQVPVLVNGDERHQPWDNNPVYDVHRHARHNGWVYKRKLHGRKLKAEGYSRDEIQIILDTRAR